MKKLLRRPTGIFLLLPLTFFAVCGMAFAEDVEVNRLLASQCAQCHGTNGYSSNGIEGIAGEEAKDMFEDLADMKGEDAPENIMDHQALGYSNDQIRRIAKYYASLPEDLPEGSQSRDADAEAASGEERNQAHEDEDDEEDEEDEDDEEDHADEDER